MDPQDRLELKETTELKDLLDLLVVEKVVDPLDLPDTQELQLQFPIFLMAEIQPLSIQSVLHSTQEV
jgi:hypothetical protein